MQQPCQAQTNPAASSTHIPTFAASFQSNRRLKINMEPTLKVQLQCQKRWKRSAPGTFVPSEKKNEKTASFKKLLENWSVAFRLCKQINP